MQIDGPRGLIYQRDFVTPKESLQIFNEINNHQWSGKGIEQGCHEFKPDYPAQAKSRDEKKNANISQVFYELSDRIRKIIQSQEDQDFNMVLVNEYELNQGIMAHTDATQIFGSVIAVISLESPAVMTFIKQSSERFDIILEQNSLLIMTNESRYLYKHEISKNELDILQNDVVTTDGEVIQGKGTTVQRSKRISLTFRHVLNDHLQQNQRQQIQFMDEIYLIETPTTSSHKNNQICKK